MSTLQAKAARIETLADLMKRLGDVPLQRVRYHPAPGTASVQDLLDLRSGETRLCELVDGVIVEKAMGYLESALAYHIGIIIGNFVIPRQLGIVAGADGMMRLFPHIVRMPDVSFVKLDRLPHGVAGMSAPLMAPNLAIEVLSKGNTRQEMRFKRKEYFAAGVELVWEVSPRIRVVNVYKSPKSRETLRIGDVLSGEPVLPGFSVPLSDLFSVIDLLERI